MVLVTNMESLGTWFLLFNTKRCTFLLQFINPQQTQTHARIDRSTTGAPSQMRVGSHWEHVTGVKDSGDTLTFPWPKYNWVPEGCNVSVYPSTTTDCPGVLWCPDPGLGGDPQVTFHRLIRSMSRHGLECIQAHRGHTHYWVTLGVALRTFTQVGSACD